MLKLKQYKSIYNETWVSLPPTILAPAVQRQPVIHMVILNMICAHTNTHSS